MDVSPQLLREVEFREQWRGYNPDEVDDFLERLAVAIGQLQEQLREAVDRASRAERRVLEGSGDEDELKRTLVLAQRTADAALAEARERAEALEAEAATRSQALVHDAEAEAARIRAEAETQLADEVAPLLAQRDALQHDVEALRTWAAEIRSRMADELRQQLAWLDGDEAELPPPPEVSDVQLPELAGPSPAPQAPAHEPLPQGAHDDPGPLVDDDRGAAEHDEHAFAPDERALPPRDAEATGVYDVLADLDDEPRSAVDRGDHGVEGGPLDTAAAADPFLAELRRAVTDDEPLGPRDRVDLAGAGHDDGEHDGDDSSSSVFRRRRR